LGLTSWIYTPHLAEDANFKQKARARPNDKRDKSLQPGQGAFVDNDKYTEHLTAAMKTNPGEVSYLTPYNTISSNDTNRSIIVSVLRR
jgi:hypothetical protein